MHGYRVGYHWQRLQQACHNEEPCKPGALTTTYDEVCSEYGTRVFVTASYLTSPRPGAECRVAKSVPVRLLFYGPSISERCRASCHVRRPASREGLHRARERSVALVKRAKAVALEKLGLLRCTVCGFAFAATYGSLGDGYIECHHTRPLSELASTRPTRVDDIALVCSNCHRMIHRRRPWLNIGERATLLGAARL